MSYLGLDVGTTGCKAGIFDAEGRLSALAYREYPLLAPEPGWAEIDSSQVAAACREVIAEAVERCAGDPVRGMWASIASGAGVADREKEAMRYVLSWASMNRSKFLTSERHRSQSVEPSGGWLGFWTQATGDGWDWVAISAGAIDDFLVSKGFDGPKAIRRQWAEAGWLVQDDPKRTTARVNQLEGRIRMVKIRRDVAESIGDLGNYDTKNQGSLPFGE